MTTARWARLDAAASRTASLDPAHDILHVRRVARNAEVLARAENAQSDIAVAAALLHELFSYPKDHPDSPRSGEVCALRAVDVLGAEGFTPDRIEAVAYCIRVHPFSLGVVPRTLEARVLQDADRLDALGAIGIARVFSTGSAMGRPFYDHGDPFVARRLPDDGRFTLDHFYRKLLRLPDTLHTATARAEAAHRVAYMNGYLDEFRREWEGLI